MRQDGQHFFLHFLKNNLTDKVIQLHETSVKNNVHKDTCTYFQKKYQVNKRLFLFSVFLVMHVY